MALDSSTSYEEDADRRTVSIQWDEDPAETQRWAISESGRDLFAPDGVAVVRRMAHAGRLRFGFWGCLRGLCTAQRRSRSRQQQS